MWKWLERLMGPPESDRRAAALYGAIVDIARRPGWYALGGVRDDVDGRFDMVALVVSLHIVRLERDDADPRARAMVSALVERFAADMDGSFREIGIGDMVIGKHMGRALTALGGRLGAYRDALAGDAPPAALAGALDRNVFRGGDVSAECRDWTANRVRAEWAALTARPLRELLA